MDRRKFVSVHDIKPCVGTGLYPPIILDLGTGCGREGIMRGHLQVKVVLAYAKECGRLEQEAGWDNSWNGLPVEDKNILEI
jgi:hypothetical protein